MSDDVVSRLEAAWYCHKRIEGNLRKIKQLRSLAQSMTPHYSQVPGSGGSKSTMENAVADIVELENDIAEKSRQLRDDFKEAEAIIDSVPDYKQRTVLCYRYLYFYRWEEIASDLHYSWAQVHRFRKNALEYLRQKDDME